MSLKGTIVSPRERVSLDEDRRAQARQANRRNTVRGI
jgi:hypothetical protein